MPSLTVNRTNFVREVRARRGYTQGALAERLGVTVACVAGYELPTRDLRSSTLRKLARALDVSISELIP